MLLNQKEYLQKQRALDSQPKMLDQAYIMRAHQTAISGPRGGISAGPASQQNPQQHN